jgi:DNA gyrase subunit A
LVNILKTELQEISDTYGDERWTEIRDVEYDIDIEDLIEEEECVFTLTKEGYIKRIECTEYRAQARGGRGVRAMTTKEEDYVETVFTASTHDVLLFFSDRGQVYKKKGYMVPSAGRQAKGMAIVNLLPLEKDEKISAVLHCRPEDLESYFVFMATAKGKVKRMNLSLLRNIRRTGIRALSIDEGDTLIGAMLTDGGERILLATRNGQAICFEETDVRPMGRTAAGVRGIRLRKGDECVGVCRWGSGRYLLSVSENGYGKRTPLRAYLRGGEAAQSRGGLGMRNFKLSEKTGKIAAAKVVNGDEDLLLVSDDGTMIRISVSEISVQGRSTQGVRVMRLSEGSLLISMAKTDPEEEIDCHDGVSLDEDPEFLEEDDFDEFEDEDIEEDELEEEFDDDDDDDDDDEEDDD